MVKVTRASSSFWVASFFCLLAASAAHTSDRNSTKVTLLSDLAPTLRLDAAAGVTVSGLSSGGYMAVQMHMAFSSLINGAAVFAGGPFYCANSNWITAEQQCMAVGKGPSGGPNVDELVDFTYRKEALGQIDPVQLLADDSVFLFSGEGDTVVDRKVVEALQDYYSHFVKATSGGKIMTEFTVHAEHCLPTLSYGEACMDLASPYIGRCQVDGAGMAISALYKGTQAPAANAQADASRLLTFSQTPYFEGSKTSLDSTGFVYVPSQCQDGTTLCRLHMSYHGCLQGQSYVGDQYPLDGGFAPWADANNLVVLFPQTVENKAIGNPNGCWDWWAYTDLSYGLKDGVQMAFSKRLLDALLL